jgi:Uma2 family endonuclease
MTTISEGQTVVTPADNVFGAKQGQWTYEHYAHLLDDGQRYEIIDGVLYNMAPAPTGSHQDAAG